MRHLVTIALICFSYLGQAQAITDFDKLNWLEGTWTRTNNKPGKTGREYWKRVSPSEWRGEGVTLVGKDTAVVEKLKIITKGGALYYVADVAENREPVLFKMTTINANHFICENPEHDFPKKIEYKLDSSRLRATISGNGKSMDYLFERR